MHFGEASTLIHCWATLQQTRASGKQLTPSSVAGSQPALCLPQTCLPCNGVHEAVPLVKGLEGRGQQVTQGQAEADSGEGALPACRKFVPMQRVEIARHTDRCVLLLVASWGFHSLPGAITCSRHMRQQLGVCCSLQAKPQPDTLQTGRQQNLDCTHRQKQSQRDGTQMVRQQCTAAVAPHAAATEPSQMEAAGKACTQSRGHVAGDEAHYCILGLPLNLSTHLTAA